MATILLVVSSEPRPGLGLGLGLAPATGGASTAAAAVASASPPTGPRVSIRVPATRGPWQPTSAKIRVFNPTDGYVLPLSLELRSAAGRLQRWGHRGAVRRWVGVRRARRDKAGRYHILPRAHAPQRIVASPRRSRGNARLAELTGVLRPGQSTQVSHAFQAAYAHGGRLRAKLRYLVIA